jgi:hypothetical protein
MIEHLNSQGFTIALLTSKTTKELTYMHRRFCEGKQLEAMGKLSHSRDFIKRNL